VAVVGGGLDPEVIISTNLVMGEVVTPIKLALEVVGVVAELISLVAVGEGGEEMRVVAGVVEAEVIRAVVETLVIRVLQPTLLQ